MRKISDLRILKHADKPIGFVLTILGAIVFSLLAAGRGPDRDSHDAVLTALRDIDFANSSLQREVLQARSGILNTYDPLAAAVARLDEVFSRLTVLGSEATMGTRLTVPLQRLSESIATIQGLVERFKTNNTMFQNSINIFTVVLTDAQDDWRNRTKFPTEWSELGNLMLRFSTHPDADLVDRLGRVLDRVSPERLAQSAKLRTIAIHGQSILNVQPSLDRLVSQIQASDTSMRTQDLQMEYLAVYGEINSRANWSRLFLGTVAVCLCLFILFLVYRLRLQTDRLARRLSFENSRNVIKTVFDDDVTSGGIDAIRVSLEEIAGLFAAASYTFAIVNVEKGVVEERYESRSTDIDIAALAAEYLRDAAEASNDARGRRNWRFYKNLQSQGELAYSLSAGAAIGIEISQRYAALMILVYPEPRPRASADDVRLMIDALELVTRCVDRHRKAHERDLLESRLAHAERLQAVGTLAAGIAHEFNNILVFMLGYGEMALQIVKRPAKARHYIAGIVSAGERARGIIEQILALSRKRERTTKPFDLSEAVSGIVTLISVSLPEAFRIETTMGQQPMVILGNPVELQQIIVNLCNNAMEACAGKGQLAIDVSPYDTRVQRALSHSVLPPGNYVRLRIADDGPGICESVMPHIFEPFFTTKSHSGGTGLGLAAVYGHIVAHAAFVDVTSVPGRSTRFDIFFPATHQMPSPLESFQDHDALKLGNGETILLLEQDQSLRLMHEEKLAALSYEPIGFGLLGDILDWVRSAKSPPNLIILDVASLGNEVGPSDLEEWFAMIPYVLILDPRRSGPLRPSNLRAMHTLSKPIDLRSLASALHSNISRPLQIV